MANDTQGTAKGGHDPDSMDFEFETTPEASDERGKEVLLSEDDIIELEEIVERGAVPQPVEGEELLGTPGEERQARYQELGSELEAIFGDEAQPASDEGKAFELPKESSSFSASAAMVAREPAAGSLSAEELQAMLKPAVEALLQEVAERVVKETVERVCRETMIQVTEGVIRDTIAALQEALGAVGRKD